MFYRFIKFLVDWYCPDHCKSLGCTGCRFRRSFL